MDKLNALYDAAIWGDVDAIAKLEMEADKLGAYDQCHILHTESQKGNKEHVRFILREFANKKLLTKLNKYKQTALHSAIYKGRTEVAKVLIEEARRHLSVTSFQAFLRQADDDKDTVLHYAVTEENLAIVKLLVEADPSDTHIQNKQGKTPMFIAVEKGLNAIIEIISTICTAPSLDGPNGCTALRINNLERVKSPGETLYKIMDRSALCDAAIAGDADALSEMEMGADILNKNGETILHIESKYSGNTERVQFILREFANKNLLTKLSIYKHTALHMAIYCGHTEVAEVLIKAAREHLPVTTLQAFLRQGDNDMDTALHAAVTEGNVAIVKLLVEADPTDRHSQNNDGKTPMYIAAEEGYTDMVKMICTTCTDPSLDGPDGSTALHAAVENRSHGIEVLEVLIDAARLLPSFSSKRGRSFQDFLRRGDENLNSALHIAVMQGNLAMAKLLVEADPSYRGMGNKNGETAFFIAAERGYADILKMMCTTCTAPLYLEGRGARHAALHAVIKNLDQGKNEVRDVIKVHLDLLKCWIIAKDKRISAYDYAIYRFSEDEIFSKTDQNGQTILELAVERNYVEVVELEKIQPTQMNG